MRIGAASLALVSLTLSGCAFSPNLVSTVSTPRTGSTAGAAITGKVRGGQSPISGAEVFLFAANNTGFGQPSKSLLNNVPGVTTLDSSGGATNGDYYVPTDANGNFTITGDYSCTAGQQVYLYAFGGNPGLTAGTNNTSLGLSAALGSCPAAGNFLGTNPSVVVNEITTVTMGFVTAFFDGDTVLEISAPNDTADQAALANAFARASLLADISTGQALATTPPGGGTAPQAQINTLANILSSCVNTNGAVSGPTNPTACYTLFNNAGGISVLPTDTASAAINIARYPGKNIGLLYGLATATAPFSPADTSQPNDFSVSVTFPLNVTGPVSLAIDGLGNTWVADKGGSKLSKYSPLGKDVLDISIADVVNPSGVAIDSSNNVFIGNSGGGGSVTGFNNSGTELTGFPATGGGITSPIGIAIDPSNNLWILNGNGTVSEISNAGTAVSPSGGYSFLPTPIDLDAILIDLYQNTFVSDSGQNAIYEFNTSNHFFLEYGSTIPNISGPQGMQADPSGTLWWVNSGDNYLNDLVDTSPGYGNISSAGSRNIGVTGAGVAAGGREVAALTAEGATVPTTPVVVGDANSTCVEVPNHKAGQNSTSNTTHFCPSTAPAMMAGSEPDNFDIEYGTAEFTIADLLGAYVLVTMFDISLPK